jgi:hypothetical protein
LREATVVAKTRSRHDWAHWRKRLSDLDTQRQIHLIAEMDAEGILRTNSIRAIDTGMSGPHIGEMQHGDSKRPGVQRPMAWTSRRFCRQSDHRWTAERAAIGDHHGFESCGGFFVLISLLTITSRLY